MVEVTLPLESQRRLIEIARQTLDAVVRRGSNRMVLGEDPHLEHANYGAFVTLFKQDELRGCIGTLTPSNGLRDTVIEMTEAAATRDPRVKPIRVDELERIHIDISVLSELTKTTEPLSLEIGRHGLHVASGGKRAVLLPQVAVEHEWDIKTFLEQTCVKAALPKDAWSWPDTVVSSFTALIIEEER
ncbi:MAG: AmmeMemoRadiSam system protein A [Candidatus Binatia bacterium]